METDSFVEFTDNETTPESLKELPDDFDVLANMPTFEEHMAELYSQEGNTRNPGDDNYTEPNFEPLTEEDLYGPINSSEDSEFESESTNDNYTEPNFKPLTEEDLLPPDIQLNTADTQSKSPINGGSLTQTNHPDIMTSEYDDNLYKVTNQGEVIPLQSSINDSKLVQTDRPDIMVSEYDDNLYKITNQDEVIPLRSPINGSKLVQTDRPDIMMSEYDDILYKITDQGKIIPLKSPINGNKLIISGENRLVDKSTNQEFNLTESGEITTYSSAA